MGISVGVAVGMGVSVGAGFVAVGIDVDVEEGGGVVVGLGATDDAHAVNRTARRTKIEGIKRFIADTPLSVCQKYACPRYPLKQMIA
jgi:hypothetical protein